MLGTMTGSMQLFCSLIAADKIAVGVRNTLQLTQVTRCLFVVHARTYVRITEQKTLEIAFLPAADVGLAAAKNSSRGHHLVNNPSFDFDPFWRFNRGGEGVIAHNESDLRWRKQPHYLDVLDTQ